MEYRKGEKLEFLGDAVEIFFFIFVDLSEDLSPMGGGVFYGEQVVESKVCA